MDYDVGKQLELIQAKLDFLVSKFQEAEEKPEKKEKPKKEEVE